MSVYDYNFKCVYANGVTMIGTHDEPRGAKFIGAEGWVFIHVHGGHLEASNPLLLKVKLKSSDKTVGRSQGISGILSTV